MGSPSDHDRDKRLSGRAAVAQRKRRLQIHPLCAHCKERGLTRVTDEIDHIVPLGFGGSDTDDNVQGLCIPCHLLKTATEDVSHAAAANHPEWLKPSAIPLTIVRGPPCSGKTTHINTHAAPHDVVIDLDSIMARLRPGYTHWSASLDPALLNNAIRVRNAMLGALARQEHGKAWFIVSSPSEAEAAWWHGKMGGELLTLHPGVDECKRRAITRGTPRAIKGIDEWERASRTPWLPPQQRPIKTGCDESGWPV